MLANSVTWVNGANGRQPSCALFSDRAGNLYGTTNTGGDLSLNHGYGFGTLFEVAAGTHTLTTLVSFNGINGWNFANPGSLISDAAGNLYGTSGNGGGYSDGTVFEVAAGTHAVTTLATFSGISVLSHK